MLLGVVLLYVGAVLVINGIWLVGQARAAQLQPAPAGGRGGAAAPTTVENHPTFIDNREIAVLNIFTGFIGVVAAVTLAVQGNQDGDLASIRGAGYILLFAFTYIWVAFNQFLNAGGHAFGWYCLFVAITAVSAGLFTFSNADGNAASIYLGIDWFAWAILWFLFFVLLALERSIARITGLVAILEGIGTSWVFAILLLEDQIAF
ncbi:MAG TPA: AmiS/UreI family transporter [Thermoleophilaceae bacterium]|nr:AmiS/UreI family transporter [Thermoleophilaceae bacterium]